MPAVTVLPMTPESGAENSAPKIDGLPDPIAIGAEAMGDSSQSNEPVKRGRGRPKKDASASDAKPTKTRAKRVSDIDALAKQVQGLHMLASMGTGIPELMISESESAMIARGLDAVAEEYGLALDGKTGAALQLFGAAAMVYVPKVLAMRKRLEAQRMAAEAEAELAQRNGNVPAH